jgi:hypothetical protein
MLVMMGNFKKYYFLSLKDVLQFYLRQLKAKIRMNNKKITIETNKKVDKKS